MITFQKQFVLPFLRLAPLFAKLCPVLTVHKSVIAGTTTAVFSFVLAFFPHKVIFHPGSKLLVQNRVVWEYWEQVLSIILSSTFKMPGANPCVVFVEFQCVVWNQAIVLLSELTILRNPVIVKSRRIPEVIKAPRNTTVYRFWHSRSSFFLISFVFYIFHC